MISEILLSYLWQESLLYYIIFTTVLCLLVIHKWRRRDMLKKLENFSSKPTLPFIGNVHHIIGNTTERIRKGFNFMLDMELPAVGWIFHVPLVIVGTPDDIQVVMNKTSDRGLLRIFEKSLGKGILLTEGEEGRKGRRTISTAFSTSMMQRYLIFFNKYSEGLIRKIGSHANTNVAFDVWCYLARLNLDTVCQNMCGYELQSLENGIDEDVEAMEISMEAESLRYTLPPLYFNFMYEIYVYLFGKRKSFETVRNLSKKMIRNATEKFRTQQSKGVAGGPKTLLNALMDDPDFSEELVEDEILDMMYAGAATAARTTSFLLLILAMHQDIQEKVYQEIKTIFGNGNRPVQKEDIDRLVYLEQCIKETLRKFPTIPITFRKHSEDIQLNDKQTIPANCHIVIFIYGLHHNEQLYPNSKIWDPERFTPEAIHERSKSAFIPFGLGPRSCLGAKYAMISIKTQMVHLIRNYRFTTEMKMEEIQIALDAALRFENGYWLKFWNRESNIL